MAFSRRKFLVLLGDTVIVGSSLWRGKIAHAKEWSLQDFTQHIHSGGPPKDGIPPIDRPKYVSAADADKFLKLNDIVFGLDRNGAVRAYPQKILVWHEIVNDEVKGEKISVTYCPLTGSAVAFRGQSREGAMFTFGTSGKLVNSNLLMYDRETDSHWPQILGAAIDGKSKGAILEEIRLVWTQWSRWRRRYPQTVVLSSETGYFRSYGSDPYGSYEKSRTYYDSGAPLFPVMAKNERFTPKDVVIGIKANGRQMALPKQPPRKKTVVNITFPGLPLVGIYDPELDNVQVFVRQVNGKPTNFSFQKGRIVDELTQSQWTSAGRAVEGTARGTELKQQPSFDVMWFAWYAFFPETQVFG
jgi:hypothetical protein